MVSCLSVQHCLAESFTPVTNCSTCVEFLFTYWAMRNIKLLHSCSNVNSFHLRHLLLRGPVSKEHCSTQYFCHQMYNASHINPLPLTDVQVWATTKQSLCVIFDISLQFSRWCLTSAISFMTFWCPCRSLFFANHQKKTYYMATQYLKGIKAWEKNNNNLIWFQIYRICNWNSEYIH